MKTRLLVTSLYSFYSFVVLVNSALSTTMFWEGWQFSRPQFSTGKHPKALSALMPRKHSQPFTVVKGLWIRGLLPWWNFLPDSLLKEFLYKVGLCIFVCPADLLQLSGGTPAKGVLDVLCSKSEHDNWSQFFLNKVSFEGLKLFVVFSRPIFTKIGVQSAKGGPKGL